MGEQDLFQDEIYRLNREIRRFSNLRKDKFPVILTAFNSLSRTFNYFPVRDDGDCRRWSLEKERRAIEDFRKSKEAKFQEFLNYFEEDVKTRTDDVHSFLISLYNNFPVPPDLFLDGIVKRFLPEFIKKGHLIRFALVNLLHKESKTLDYNYFPWADIRFYCLPPDINSKMGTIADQESNRAERYEQSFDDYYGAIADQESNRAEKYGQWFDGYHGTFEEVKQRGVRPKIEGLHLEPFFFEYLQPLFMGSEKGEKIFGGEEFFYLKEQDLAGLEHLLVIPFYDAWIDGRPCGSLKGNLFIPFENDSDYSKRLDFIENNFQSFAGWSQKLNGLLFESRGHNLLRLPVQFVDNSLKDFLSKIVHVQDWEKVGILFKSELGKPEFCFKRESGKLCNYKESWIFCRPGEHCFSCIPSRLKDVDFSSIKKEPFLLKNSDSHGHLLFLDLKDLLDPKILPSIQPGEAAFYEDLVICFELPKGVYLPEGGFKKENLKRLRAHYIEELIPVFDKVLLKNKFMKHSIKSAVAAIISRNHSHHIGSHVTPRCSLEKVGDRLNELGFDDRQLFQDAEALVKRHCGLQQQIALEEVREFLKKECVSREKWEIAASLKLRLDNYVQKKADFVSEISTEPLTTTKTMSFFNEIVLPFIQNTLLMDNIGANEGVNFKKGKDGHNRLRIHVHHEDRELEAGFRGGPSCSCAPVTHLHYPYSGCCGCPSPSALVTEPEMKDVAVAVPGPLGEFALYAFLENLIRNAVKHNHSTLRKTPERNLDIHIKLSEFEEKDEKKDDFYKVEIWDSVTNPDEELKKRLTQFINDPVIDQYGRIKRRAWGIAEMKMMATLLGGTGDFSRMESSLRVKGDDRLVYEFRIMKPKEIALISGRFSAKGDFRKKGIWCFSSLDDFLTHQAKGASAAAFNIAVLDKDVSGDLIGCSHLFPNRVLVHDAIEARLPGAVRIGDEFVEAIQRLKPEEMISRAWKVWLKGLAGHSNEVEKLRPVVFFGQEDEVSPTKEWLRLAKELEVIKDGPRLSVVYQGEDDNEVLPAPSRNERLFVFDRHFDGYPALPGDAIAFHEAFDKNSLDFVPIFSAEPSDVLVCQMAESAYLRVLVMDERITEVAYEEILRDENEKPKRLYGQKERITVNKWGNVFLASHLKINDESTQPLHHSIGLQFPRILVELRTGDVAGGRVRGLEATWIHKEGDQDVKERFEPHILIIHQGVIENFLEAKIPKKPNEDLVDALEAFFKDLRQFVPFIVVDSGRGIPANLPGKIKFIPFSLIEDYLMRERISKFHFTRIIMSLIRRGNP